MGVATDYAVAASHPALGIPDSYPARAPPSSAIGGYAREPTIGPHQRESRGSSQGPLLARAVVTVAPNCGPPRDSLDLPHCHPDANGPQTASRQPPTQHLPRRNGSPDDIHLAPNSRCHGAARSHEAAQADSPQPAESNRSFDLPICRWARVADDRRRQPPVRAATDTALGLSRANATGPRTRSDPGE